MTKPNNADATSVQSVIIRPFESWLDRNSDFKRRHVGPVPIPELGGHYECDQWYFVCDDHGDGETPAIVIKIHHEERVDYMVVEVENWDESGNPEGSCFLGLFRDTGTLESVLRALVKVNRYMRRCLRPKVSRWDIMFCCNDHRNGMATGKVDTIKFGIGRGNFEFGTDWCDDQELTIQGPEITFRWIDANHFRLSRLPTH